MSLSEAFSKPGLSRLALGLALSTAAGVFLGLVGPFGSYRNDGAAVRIAYFVGTFWIASLLYAVAMPGAARWAGRLSAPIWLWAPLVTAVVAIPAAAVSRVAALALWPWLGARVGLLEWYGQCLLVSAAAVGIGALLFRDWLRPAAAPVVVGSSDTGSRLTGAVLCLQMEDHYVRVHRPGGSELVLMPMAQAVEAMPPGVGLRVHRSWWVARDAVEAAVPDGRQWRLRLRGGLEAPVSRPNVAVLKQAGWL